MDTYFTLHNPNKRPLEPHESKKTSIEFWMAMVSMIVPVVYPKENPTVMARTSNWKRYKKVASRFDNVIRMSFHGYIEVS